MRITELITSIKFICVLLNNSVGKADYTECSEIQAYGLHRAVS
jgi:hypothetical protein